MSVKQVQAIVNGQTYTLTYNSNTGKYETTVTAPSRSSYSQSGHYYGITNRLSHGASQMMILVLIRLLSVSQSIPEVRLLTALQRLL